MDKYTKLHMVTQGGYGTIYKATSSRGVQVVLKEVILANQEEEEVQVTRKEAQLLSSLSHPHIIRYVDHWETPDLLTIAMEYAEGGSLEKVISKRESHFEETEALKIFVEVVAAVEYLHRKEIIHRDICARNVLVCSTGVIKLCDFGVSKRMRSVRTGSLKGDPSHFAPELCYGGKYVQFDQSHWGYLQLIYMINNDQGGRTLLVGSSLRGTEGQDLTSSFY
uniref:non-specific serine/threonine protein kinase n=1 Tax=Lygus hesperus TaxID=30085 RepID=A0A146KL47_LYGHE